MFYPDTFQISTPSDREIRITRDFDAPRQLGGSGRGWSGYHEIACRFA